MSINGSFGKLPSAIPTPQPKSPEDRKMELMESKLQPEVPVKHGWARLADDKEMLRNEMDAINEEMRQNSEEMQSLSEDQMAELNRNYQRGKIEVDEEFARLEEQISEEG